MKITVKYVIDVEPDCDECPYLKEFRTDTDRGDLITHECTIDDPQECPKVQDIFESLPETIDSSHDFDLDVDYLKVDNF